MSRPGPGRGDRKDLLKRALRTIDELQAKLVVAERGLREPIAVVGLGCRFPGGANDPWSFWSLLRDGRDAVGEVPLDRWDTDAYFDPDADVPGKMYTRCAALLDRVDGFDAEFFGITPREIIAMDPQQRLLLEVGWEALEHSGHAPKDLAGSATAVFVGIGSRDYSQLQMQSGDLAAVDTYFGSGTSQSIASGRLAYALGLQGPAISVDTACSSSLVAVHLACQGLRTGDCDLALAGGVNLILSPVSTITASRAQMLSPDGRCKTFDAAADGYGRGEGCGMVVLKRLSDALRDNDNILALLRGTATNQDGRSSGLTAPNGPAQEAVIREALTRSGLSANRVSYLETHGTGTSLGDPIEVRALADVLGEGRAPDAPLGIGSVKTNIGHLEAAAGVAGLIKTILALYHREIPPHLHFQTPNPLIPWDRIPVRVIDELTPWTSDGDPLVAGVSSFGFSGTNVHVIVEEAPAVEASVLENDRPLHILPLSARNEAALAELVERYEQHLGRLADDHSGAAVDPLADVCFTAGAGRDHFTHRTWLVAPSVSEARKRLAALPSAREGAPIDAGIQRREVAFLYSGQGSQYPRMARRLYETQPTFRAALQECAAAVSPCLEKPLLEVLYGSPEHGQLIHQTAYTQPALFAIEYALTRMWRSWGIEPSFVMGHSVGEYVAACVAGVVALQDGLRLIAERARLMQQLPAGGGMASVLAPESEVRRALAGATRKVSIAAINGPDSTVVSGERAALGAVVAELEGRGFKTKLLTVSHAFHSPLMEPMMDQFERFAAGIQHRPPRLGMISNLTGEAIGAKDVLGSDYWSRHVREPVRFQAGIESLVAQGCEIFIEMGPTPVLLGMAQACVPGAKAAWLPALRKGRDDWEQTLDSLGKVYERGVDVDWKGFDCDYRRRRTALPAYPFQRQRYWIETNAPSRTSEHPDWLYEIAWQEREEEHWEAPARPAQWLIFADAEGGVGDALAAELTERGQVCRLVRGGDGHDDDAPEAVSRVITEAVSGKGPALRGVVYLWGMSLSDPEVNGTLAAGQRAACGGLLRLTQSLAKLPSPPALYVVTRGGQPVGDREGVHAVAQAPLWGLARTIALEHPELRCLRIDLDPEQGPAPASSRRGRRIADPAGAARSAPEDRETEKLVEALFSTGSEDQVALRRGSRYVARLVRSPLLGAVVPPSIRAEASYLVTGGLGGLGLEVTRWLLDRGAGHVVLTGRSVVTDAKAAVLDELGSRGGEVAYVRGDVAERADVEHVLDEIGASGRPLAGVVHTAGILDDGMLVRQDWARFERVMAPKVWGAWNLHEATRNLNLDFFVMFSAGATVLGSPGQGNYTAANAFMDALAHRRRALGLPALSINWGPWAEVGMAAELGDRHLARQASLGIRSIAPAQGIETLERLLQGAAAQVAVLAVEDWDMVASMSAGAAPMRFLTSLTRRGNVADRQSAAAASALAQRLENAAPEEQRELVRAYVRDQVCRVTGLDASAIPSLDRPLAELGLDSLMATQLKNKLDDIAGPIPLAGLLEGPSINCLTDTILSLREQASPELIVPIGTPGAARASGDAERLLGALPELSDQQVDSLLDELLAEGDTR